MFPNFKFVFTQLIKRHNFDKRLLKMRIIVKFFKLLKIFCRHRALKTEMTEEGVIEYYDLFM